MADRRIRIELWCLYSDSGYGVTVVPGPVDPPPDKKLKCDKVTFLMRPWTWKMQNDLLAEATFRNEGVDSILWTVIVSRKLVYAIDGWDLKGPDGEAVPATEENILGLHPAVAEALLRKYDNLTAMTRGKEKEIVLSTFRYYSAALSGSHAVPAPPEVVELSLMEKFGWTPQQIDEIPYVKIQEMFLVMNQREQTHQSVQEKQAFEAQHKADLAARQGR